MAKETPKARPDYHVFVVEEKEGKEAFWWKIGAAWANKDGKGYSVEFMTPNGPARLVLREPSEESKTAWARVEILVPLATSRPNGGGNPLDV